MSAICGSEALPPFQGLKYGGGPDPGVSPLANDCRRSAAKAIALAILVVAIYSVEHARAADKVQMDEPAKKAVGRGLEWLASKQNSDGSWSESRYPHNTAITAFALVAF